MPFRSKKQMKACYATDGFGGKINCEEWQKDTPKKLPNRVKKKMQTGGPSPLVDLPQDNIDQGTQEAKSFIKNWNTQRAKDPRFADVAGKRAAMVDGIPVVPTDLKIDEMLGYADEGKVYIDPRYPASTGRQTQNHEFNHILTDTIPQPGAENIIKSNQGDRSKSSYNDDLYGYSTDPAEVQSFLGSFRMRYNLDPNKNYTTQEMQQIMNQHKSTLGQDKMRRGNNGDNDVDKLLEATGNDPEKLRNLNRDIVSGSQNMRPQSKYGGKMRYGGLKKMQYAGSTGCPDGQVWNEISGTCEIDMKPMTYKPQRLQPQVSYDMMGPVEPEGIGPKQPYDPFGIEKMVGAPEYKPGTYTDKATGKQVSMYPPITADGLGPIGSYPTTDENGYNNEQYLQKGKPANTLPGEGSGEGSIEDQVKRQQKKSDPFFALRGLSSGLAWLGQKREQSRQRQYMMNQYSTMGQMDPVNVRDYQPTYNNMYAQRGGSVVDTLKARGQDSSREARARMAQELGIEGYDYSAAKNIELMSKLPDNAPATAPAIEHNMSFGEAFRDATNQGQGTFNWRGKSYTTEQAKVPTPESPVQAPIPTRTPAPVAPSPTGTFVVPRLLAAPAARDYTQTNSFPTRTQPIVKTSGQAVFSSSPGTSTVPRLLAAPAKEGPRTYALKDTYAANWTPSKPAPKATTKTTTPSDAPIKTSIGAMRNSIDDVVELGLNGAKRYYDKYFGDDTKAISKLPIPKADTTPQPVKGTTQRAKVVAPPAYVPPIVTGDTLWDSKREYHIPEKIDLLRVKMGARNRGDNTPVSTDGHIFTAFDKQRIKTPAEVDDNGTYVGVDDEGNVRAGVGSSFKDKNYKILQFNSKRIKGFAKDADGQYIKDDSSGASPGTWTPAFQTANGRTNSNLLVKYKEKNGTQTYGNVTGGKALFTSPDYSKQVIISGSVETIEQQLEAWKKENGLSEVNYMMLDNGSYARGYRTKDGMMSEKDWRKADKRNWDGNSGFYLKGKGL